MNNNLIPNQPNNKLYVAHSIIKENMQQARSENNKNDKAHSKATPVQIINRSYYYDSNGGGYQGL